MDNRLVFTVLVVMMSLDFTGTYAQAPAPAPMPAPAPAPTTTTAATTTTPTPTTTTAATTTTPTPTTTTAATTTTPTPTTTTAATTTTPAPTTTTAATTTTPAPTPTTAATTTTPTTTTAATTTTPTTTTADSTTPSITITTPATTGTIASPCPISQTSVNRSQCATQKLCAAEPSGCDPSTDTSCFFTSAQQNSGQKFTFELTGVSTGFIAVILLRDPTPGSINTAYVCINKNGMVDVHIAIFVNNNTLILTKLGVTCVSGRINRDRIECTFTATIPDLTARKTSFALSVVNGTFNSTSVGLEIADEVLRSPVLNLAQPNVTVINVLNNSTTNHAITIQQSVMQALLITVATLGLSML